MKDIFGFEQTIKSEGGVASSEFAAIAIGDMRSSTQGLIQSVSINYGMSVETVVQIGDPTINWVPGRPIGSINVGKLVGSGGFFEGVRNANCGKITPLSVNLNGGNCGFSGRGTINFSGGIVESLSVSITSAQMTISETVSIRAANMTAS